MLRFRQYFIHLFLTLKNFHFEGEDGYGSRYYKKVFSKKRAGKSFEKRIVIYHGCPEATNISPEWYGWIHFICEKVPLQKTFSGNQRRCAPSWAATVFQHQNSLEPRVVPVNCAYVRWTPNEEMIKGPHEKV